MASGTNEAAFLGGIQNQSVVAKKPEKKPRKASDADARLKETLELLGPAADRLIMILKEDLAKEDSNVHLVNRLRGELGHEPTFQELGEEMRASCRYVEKVNRLIAICVEAKHKDA